MRSSRKANIKIGNTGQILARYQKAVGSSSKITYYPMVAREAHGFVVTDIEGKKYLDFNSSWTVASLGYCNDQVVKAVSRELHKSLGLATVSIHPTELTLRFADQLIDLTPGRFEKAVWFGHSGSDACGAAFKLFTRVTGKERVISFIGAMHGVDLGGIAVAGHPSTAQFRIPSLATKIPYAYCYRCPYHLEFPSCGTYCGGDFLEEQVLKYISPKDDTSFLIVEPIQSDAGDIVPPTGFLEKLQKSCKRNGILFVVDEVKTGFGRTGQMFAVQKYPYLIPDAVCLGKSMGSGIPVGAVVARRELLDTGFAVSTLSCSNLAAAAGLATISFLRKRERLDRISRIGDYMEKGLRELMEHHQLIGDIRGTGLIFGIELVENRKTKKPAKIEAAKCVYRAWKLGLLISFVGADSNVIELTPPLIIGEGEIDSAVGILDKSLKDVENGLVPDATVDSFKGF